MPTGLPEWDNELQEIENNLLGISTNIDNIVAAIASGSAPSPSLMDKLAELEREADRLRADEDRLIRQYAYISSPSVEKKLAELLEGLESAPLDILRINSLLRQLLNGITINWETGYLILEWKHGGEDTEILFTIP